MSALSGVFVVTIAINLPGPAAARRLVGLGASVTKIEPPGGDPMASYHARWYPSLAAGQEVRQIDLKSPAGLADLDALRASALTPPANRGRAAPARTGGTR